MLLAFAPPAFQDEVLSRPLPAVTSETMTDPALIRKYLADIRQRGYVALPGIGVKDGRASPCPLRPDNTVAAALNAIVPRKEAAVPLTVPAS